MSEIDQKSSNCIQIHGLELNHPNEVQAPISKINTLFGYATPRLGKIYSHLIELN